MIFRLDPILRPMVWGSELWVLSGYPERMSVVADGPCKGMTINELVARYKGSLLGAENYRRFGDEFPLLVKFLDVHDALSIQVHPSEELAQARCGQHGKNEMWYVIRAEKGAELMAGLSQQITPDEYVRRVADGTITDVLAHHSISEGDVFFIPTGRIHALLPGSYIAEIQQTSDMTYRLYDYNRPGLDGKPRELHTEKALDVVKLRTREEIDAIRFSVPVKIGANGEVLASCDYFTVVRYVTAPGRTALYTSTDCSFAAFLVLEAEDAQIECGNFVEPIHKG